MRLYEIEKHEFDEFASNNKIRNFYQTSEYGDWMEKRGFNCLYLALIDDQKNIHAASLIIYKNIFGNNSKWSYRKTSIGNIFSTNASI